MKTLTNQHSEAARANSIQVLSDENDPHEPMRAALFEILNELDKAARHTGPGQHDFDKELRDSGNAPVYTSLLDALNVDCGLEAFIKKSLETDSERAAGEPTVIEKIRTEVGHYSAPLLFPAPSPQK